MRVGRYYGTACVCHAAGVPGHIHLAGAGKTLHLLCSRHGAADAPAADGGLDLGRRHVAPEPRLRAADPELIACGRMHKTVQRQAAVQHSLTRVLIFCGKRQSNFSSPKHLIPELQRTMSGGVAAPACLDAQRCAVSCRAPLASLQPAASNAHLSAPPCSLASDSGHVTALSLRKTVAVSLRARSALQSGCENPS